MKTKIYKINLYSVLRTHQIPPSNSPRASAGGDCKRSSEIGAETGAHKHPILRGGEDKNKTNLIKYINLEKKPLTIN